MLKTLIVKNYALIEHIEVEFEKGLNIITGETGAGKSILLDALGLLLGERASNEIIRKDAAKAYVEGIFNIDENEKVKRFLNEQDIDLLNELILRREISAKGSNRAFVNDTPVTLNVFKEIGNLLVDLHGQHEHQSLLRTETHIDYLDEFAGNENLLKEYRSAFSIYNKHLADLKHLQSKEAELKEKEDFLRFQLNEIMEVDPQAGEEEELQQSLNILENLEKVNDLSARIYTLLYDSEGSVNDQLGEVQKYLSELSRFDKKVEEQQSEFSEAFSMIKDISYFFRSYSSSNDLDQNNLEEIRSRLSKLNLLKKKHGGSIDKILELKEKLSVELDLSENFSDKISVLKKQIEQDRNLCLELGNKISSVRAKASKSAEKEIEDVLKFLGIEKSIFKVKILTNKEKLTSKGIDDIEFFISTNAGEEPKPLVKVASGGEVSRIMLSLKAILAKTDKLPLLVFDEIDTGVSGRIAQKIGKVMKELSNKHQIISITHLPQIACFADKHFSIEKKTSGNNVNSIIRPLNKDEQVNEIAKLLSGEEVTQTGIKTAKELLLSASQS